MAEPLMVDPVDPDADPRVSARRAGTRPVESPVLVVVAVGGAIGASARYGASLLWPTASDAFPWTTLLVNSLGCAVIGVFMVLLTEVWAAHRLVRPFFGTGVLGGFTTFSTYAMDVQRLADRGQPQTALAYFVLTPAAALASVRVAAAVTRLIVRRERVLEAP